MPLTWDLAEERELYIGVLRTNKAPEKISPKEWIAITKRLKRYDDGRTRKGPSIRKHYYFDEFCRAMDLNPRFIRPTQVILLAHRGNHPGEIVKGCGAIKLSEVEEHLADYTMAQIAAQAAALSEEQSHWQPFDPPLPTRAELRAQDAQREAEEAERMRRKKQEKKERKKAKREAAAAEEAQASIQRRDDSWPTSEQPARRATRSTSAASSPGGVGTSTPFEVGSSSASGDESDTKPTLKRRAGKRVKPEYEQGRKRVKLEQHDNDDDIKPAHPRASRAARRPRRGAPSPEASPGPFPKKEEEV
ncbi:hypothetical protein JCM10207_005975 [Rhodosporidiobolus poonsookiae]